MALPDDFHELAARVRNWGRWGDADERGTLNLITAEAVRRGVAAVRTGRCVPLSLSLSQRGPQSRLMPGRINPLRTMLTINQPLTKDPEAFSSSDDVVVMGLQAATHWDSLAHVSYGGRLYNGHPADSIDTSGARRCGIDKVGPLVSRGVLLDVARATGVDRLEPAHAITAAELAAAEELAKTHVQPGDVVLVRTGHLQLFHAGDRTAYTYPSPGLSLDTVTWLRERDIAAVAGDTLMLEVFPNERDDLVLPVHLLHLVDMGLLQGENWDLEGLAADCADDGASTFLLQATPEPFFRGLGGPVAPVAVK